MRKVMLRALAALIAIAALGCQDTCEPGETQSCLCAGGASGAQVCAAGGDSWGACDCTGGTDTDSDTDTGADADTDTDTDTDECVDEDPFNPTECPEIDASDARVRYVDADVATPGDGKSWSTAFARVQPAVDACRCVALVLEQPCQVWVAAGEYEVFQYWCRTDTLRMRPGVELYGGFAGGETSLGARDWEANVTTLTGDGFSYHVVVGADDATLDGFTITGGNADGESTETVNRSSGGGMQNIDASPTVTNCMFSGNSAEGLGGGMFNRDSSPTVTGCGFFGNSAIEGGAGMANLVSTAVVTGCTFSGNSGGGMYNAELPGAAIIVTDCTFSNNTGGGMINWNVAPVVTRCTFSGNTATGGNGGGGMYNYQSAAVVTSCTFSGNTATPETAVFNGGGGMLNLWSSPILTNCAFTGNLAIGGSGGAMLNYDEYGGTTTVTFCSFSDNFAELNGGGMFSTEGSSPVVRNSVFWGNTADGFGDSVANDASTPTFRHCELEGCGASIDSWAAVCGTDLGGNIDADPLFADAASGDLSLTAGSPCIDTGDDDLIPSDVADLDGDDDTGEPLPFDLAGALRDVDGDGNTTAITDMGAFEYQP
jgi:hypothetical protein